VFFFLIPFSPGPLKVFFFYPFLPQTRGPVCPPDIEGFAPRPSSDLSPNAPFPSRAQSRLFLWFFFSHLGGCFGQLPVFCDGGAITPLFSPPFRRVVFWREHWSSFCLLPPIGLALFLTTFAYHPFPGTRMRLQTTSLPSSQILGGLFPPFFFNCHQVFFLSRSPFSDQSPFLNFPHLGSHFCLSVRASGECPPPLRLFPPPAPFSHRPSLLVISSNPDFYSPSSSFPPPPFPFLPLLGPICNRVLDHSCPFPVRQPPLLCPCSSYRV